MATDLLASTFGRWQAVENSALGIAELAALLNVPGRKCSNGVEVPLKNVPIGPSSFRSFGTRE